MQKLRKQALLAVFIYIYIIYKIYIYIFFLNNKKLNKYKSSYIFNKCIGLTTNFNYYMLDSIIGGGLFLFITLSFRTTYEKNIDQNNLVFISKFIFYTSFVFAFLFGFFLLFCISVFIRFGTPREIFGKKKDMGLYMTQSGTGNNKPNFYYFENSYLNCKFLF